MSGSGPAEPAAEGRLKMDRLKSRADFLRAQRGARRITAGLTLEFCSTPEDFVQPLRLRVGYTASRKIGGAVQRNRAKRRLRAAAAAVLPLYGREGNDYVLVARPGTLTRPFTGLLDDLAGAVRAAHAKGSKARAAKAGPSPPSAG